MTRKTRLRIETFQGGQTVASWIGVQYYDSFEERSSFFAFAGNVWFEFINLLVARHVE